jgi:hypothetical protein
MSDDQPLYLPEEFEREHLADARRSVADGRGRRAAVRRVAAAAVSPRDARRRWSLAVAWMLHAVAAVLVLAISAATGTWVVGLVMLVMVAISMAVTARVLHVLAVARAREAAAAPPPRSNERRTR